ncbi:MAG: hypothetical protein IJ567_01970 [Lachnospiraceae bacterium]|nr:hypothetical protein [Lachnospiraceae bacterium]
MFKKNKSEADSAGHLLLSSYEKWAGIVFLSIVMLFLVFVAVASFVSEDILRSETENRNLCQFVEPDLDSVFDGSWESGFEEYNKDQFVFRSQSIKLYYGFLDLLRVSVRNGFVKGLDDCILSIRQNLPPTEEYGEQQVEAMVKLQHAADGYGGRVIYMNVPHHNEFFFDKYPPFYENAKESDDAKRASIIQKTKDAGIDVIETYDLLTSKKNEYVYFFTDHHWTQKGACYAYRCLLEHINRDEKYPPMELPDWDELPRAENPAPMAGSYLLKWGDSGSIAADYLEYVLPDDMPSFNRFDNGMLSEAPVINKDKNSYSAFMDGDMGNTVIETSREQLPSVLYVGLSYTNVLEVLSIYNFNRVESIDPRYWDGVICDYISESQPDFIVVLRDDLYSDNPEIKCKVD